MRKISLILTILFITAGLSGLGQEKEMPPYGKGMQQGPYMHQDCPYHGMGMGMQMGMQMGMHGMMMQKYAIIVDKLPGYSEKLGLNEDQTTRLIDIRAKFQVEKASVKAEMAKNQMRLEKMMGEDASSAELRDQLRICSDNRIDMQLAAYDAKKEMMEVLNEEQKEKMMDLWSDHPEDCPMRMHMQKLKKKKMMMKK